MFEVISNPSSKLSIGLRLDGDTRPCTAGDLEILCEIANKNPQAASVAVVPLNSLLYGDPWPLKDVLKKLVGATNILLNDHSYDGHGWEQINAARDRAVKILETI